MSEVIESCKVDVLDIPMGNGLDPITVFWRNWEAGRGDVTITCYGMAWTAYFGGMSGDTIQQFFKRAGVDYLVTKLMDARHHKTARFHTSYLTNIVSAIKAMLMDPVRQ